MKNIQVLDCTLRDGGRIFDCKFKDNIIYDVISELTNARIDIVEVGFLRDKSLITYNHNSTFFNEIANMKPFIPINQNETCYVAFIDFGMFDISKLEKCDGYSITGIRVGFTKEQFDTKLDEIKNICNIIKNKGYKLFIQSVNSLAYTDRDMLNLIDAVNYIKPYSFGIVDTYGGMYLEDLTRIFHLVDYNLNSDIAIDLHSHNNFQLSFAFAQEIIRLSNNQRELILDCTLNGMGKCAGNLNTELICDYLNRKKVGNYDLDIILDIIDRYRILIDDKYHWGYSIPAFISGIYKSHPNNVLYLTEKYRLNSKDIKYILSAIDEKKRQRYDYDNINSIYIKYNSTVIDDTDVITYLKNKLLDKKVIILAPGKSIKTHLQIIKDYINKYKDTCVVISINFVPEYIKCDYYFYANTIHWERVCNNIDLSKCILTSNIHKLHEKVLQVNYASLIEEDSKLFDNSTIMLLNLLEKLNISDIYIAGFDGLKEKEENYVDDSFINNGHGLSTYENNQIIKNLFDTFIRKNEHSINISMITPSEYT